MFLYEGKFGNLLHTGDCRLTIECLQQLPLKYVGTPGKEPKCQLDCIFLDCTFGQSPLKMPSRQAAIQQVLTPILVKSRTIFLSKKRTLILVKSRAISTAGIFFF